MKLAIVMTIPKPTTAFPKLNPLISIGGSPALDTPAPPIMADFEGTFHP
jgi:hypothetical protein